MSLSGNPTNPPTGVPALRQNSFDFNPLQISGLSMWIDAADPSSYTLSGTTVVAVRDKSQRNLPLGTATNWTYLTTFNTSFPGFQLSFTPGNVNPPGKLGAGAIFPTATPFTIFVVAHANLSTQAGFVLDSIDATGTPRPFIWLRSMATSYNGLALNYWQNAAIGTFAFVAGTNTSYTYPNGDTSVQVVGNLTGGTPNGISIGNRGTNNQGWPGIIAEILIYSGELSLTNRQIVEGYLAGKWGLRGSLPASHPFKSVSPTAQSPFPLANTISYLPVLNGGVFNPRNITGTFLWLDAADTNAVSLSGTNVIGWTDKSPSPITLTLTGTPTYSNRGVQFSGTQNFLNSSISLNMSAMSVFAVSFGTRTGAAGSGGLMSLVPIANGVDFNQANAITYNFSSTQGQLFTTYNFFVSGVNQFTQLSNPGIFTHIQNGTAMSLFNAGTRFYTTTLGSAPGTTTGIILGARVQNGNGTIDHYLTGGIYEVIIYNTAVSDFDRQRVEGYLAWKWGLVTFLPPNHPFRLFPPPP